LLFGSLNNRKEENAMKEAYDPSTNEHVLLRHGEIPPIDGKVFNALRTTAIVAETLARAHGDDVGGQIWKEIKIAKDFLGMK
jgi:hypothetical protein